MEHTHRAWSILIQGGHVMHWCTLLVARRRDRRIPRAKGATVHPRTCPRNNWTALTTPEANARQIQYNYFPAASTHLLRQSRSQNHRSDHLRGHRLEHVGTAAHAIPDHVSHQIRHNSGVSGIILWDARLHLSRFNSHNGWRRARKKKS